MSAYASLETHFKKINDLAHVSAIASWDEASMMPVGGGQARGQAMATLSVLMHEMVTQTQVGDWIAEAAQARLSAWQSANLREIGRVYREATCMPSDLVEAQQLATSKSEQAWRECRAANDWNTMKPLLAEVVNLSRREAEVRSSASDLGLYDALLDTYKPDVRSAQLDEVFADLKFFLPPFLDQVLGSQAQETLLPVTGDFSIEKQRALGMQIMGSLGFDFEHGRLDVSHHPFCGGVPEDVRITTRYDTESFVSAIMAVIHETGHAMYEQGLPKDWTSQPVGNALSAGTHESQSLLMEMQACRTKEFMNFMTPLAQRSFLGTETNDPAWSADNIYKLYTRVEKGFIRVDADEVTYPLHVILRYEIEKDLIEGKIEVSDLPALWHEKMTRYLGVATENNYTDGLLQDVHWPAGLFGYFPTYTLGAMTAAQLFSSARESFKGLAGELGQGNFENLLFWLRENVHSKGKFLSYNDLMMQATGETINASYFKNHLKERYLLNR